MKTFKQIQQLVEILIANAHISENKEVIGSVRDNFMPLLQFNIDASTEKNAQKVLNKIAENVSHKSSCHIYLTVNTQQTKWAI